jgi:hypothetical protein
MMIHIKVNGTVFFKGDFLLIYEEQFSFKLG